MNQETGEQMLQVLREIRDAQRDALQKMEETQALVREQIALSRSAVAESVGMQRLALQRQRSISLVALPAILICIAAIGYLVLRYF